jgi:hypothetical protein
MRPIWVSGEGEHGVRPYNTCVGANSMFALHLQPSRLILPDIRTRFIP